MVSVWDKRGVAECGRRLGAAGLNVVSTGGTAVALAEAGVAVSQVTELTQFPEILDGRVKTLHPAVHAGLLARRDSNEHMSTLEAHGYQPVDVLVSNLYPFSQVVQTETFEHEVAIEHIDIGGPAMLRAAAKNYSGVIVLIDPTDYDPVLSLIEAGGVEAVPDSKRRQLAAKAFYHVSVYDSLVARYLAGSDDSFPSQYSTGGQLMNELTYGENPHQQAAVYTIPAPGAEAGISTWTVHQDKQLSYNNYLDASAALRTVQEFEDPAVAIVKHTLPCGVGVANKTAEAFHLALSGDPVSAFGGILGSNRLIDIDTVDAIGRLRLDVMIAPEYSPSALERLERRKNLRLVRVGNMNLDTGREVRSIPGGLLVQDPDVISVTPQEWTCVTERQATVEELDAMAFAWRVVRNVKSNAIVLAKPGVVTGIGAGQPNRVESVRIAVKVAGDSAAGSVLASDAFFPFADGIAAAAEAGVSAIVQPGGSVRDEECIQAANQAGMTMFFTGIRHFRH